MPVFTIVAAATAAAGAVVLVAGGLGLDQLRDAGIGAAIVGVAALFVLADRRRARDARALKRAMASRPQAVEPPPAPSTEALERATARVSGVADDVSRLERRLVTAVETMRLEAHDRASSPGRPSSED